MDLILMWKYEYVILDLGAVEPEKLQETDADLMLAVLPPLSRLARAKAWMNAKVLFVSGDEELVLDIFCRDFVPGIKDVFMLPYKYRFPNGDRKADEYCSNILRSILPERKRNKVLGFL